MKEQVKELRKKLELTMEKFGERLGVKKNTVSQWESGTNALSDQMLKLICNINWDGRYVNEEWLRTGQGDMFVETPEDTLGKLQQGYGLDDFGYGLISEYLKLDEKKRDAVRQYFYNVLLHDKANAPKKEEEMDIDAMVESYRQQLILEKKAMEKSEALQKGS